MEPGQLSADERAELERLRAQVAAYQRRRWARGGRWLAATALLLVAAVLGGLAVVAGYLRAEVLDTDSYVETVAPLGQDLAVRQATADRLADEIILRTGVADLAAELADRLVEQGAPERVTELVGPAVSGLRSFLYDQLYALLGTPQFQRIWEEANRAAHTGLVAVLTGEDGELIGTDDTSITVDLGAILSAAKPELIARGIDVAARIPDVSIPYELVDSPELPTLRRYASALDSSATWLPFLALAGLGAGVIVAPNRRRGLITGAAAIGVVAVGLLAALAVARGYYLDNLPPTIRSPDAAEAVIDTLSRFLVASLQTLLVAAVVVMVAALLAGPSQPATAIRRVLNAVLDTGARALGHAGSWVPPTGRALSGAKPVVRVVVVLAAVTGLILAERPGIAAVLWTTLAVLLLFAVLEVFSRTPARGPAAEPSAANRQLSPPPPRPPGTR
jgi:hypothetical protein